MEALQPYFKYILYLISILGFLWVNRIFITDPALRKWLMVSFEDENGRTSSKNLSAFACTLSIIVGWFISIHYSQNHIAPEYYFWGLLSLICGLYGIKEIGRVSTAKYTYGNGGSGDVANQDDAIKKWKESGSQLSFSEWSAQQGK